MIRFTCVTIGSGPIRVTERAAENADKAADAHTKALHAAFWADPWRIAKDRHGSGLSEEDL